jgi:hypothetical protein
MLINLKRKPISAHASKGPESTSNSACSLAEPVLAAFQMGDELAVLNAHLAAWVRAFFGRGNPFRDL